MTHHIMRAGFLLAVAALAMAVTFTVTPFQAVANDSCQFADVPESSGSDVVYACQQGWFQGYPDGTFQPNRRIPQHQIATVINRVFPTGSTRADMATFLRGGNPGDPADSAGFSDVPPTHPQHQDIAYAKEQGWFTGYPDGNFRPEQSITPAQIVTVLQRAFPTGSTRADLAAFMRNGDQALTTTLTQLSDDIGSWAWSPTRDQIAYTTTAQDAEGNELNELRVATTDGSTTRKLYDTIHEIRSFIWSPTGDKIAYIVVTRDERGERLREGLLVVSTEDQTQNILTDPITIKSVKWADTVPMWMVDGYSNSYHGSLIIWSWSPSGDKIAFTVADHLRVELWVAEVDGSNTPTMINKSASYSLYLRIEWSADGNHIAYTVHDGNAPLKAVRWVARADGSNTRKLSENERGQWSPSGANIIYHVDSELWVARADGSNARKLSNNGGGQWSPSGEHIAYTVGTRDALGNSELWVTDVDGSDAWIISNLASTLEWSPDGMKITYKVTKDAGGEGLGELWVTGADGSNARKLSNYGHGKWSPSGDKIAYTVRIRDSQDNRKSELWITGADGSNTQRISSEYDHWSERWSPNGDHLAYTVAAHDAQGNRRSELWVTGTDGSNTRRLSNQKSDWKWSPGGNHIAYTINEQSWQGDRKELWITKVN